MRIKILVVMVLVLAVVFGSGCAKKRTYVGPGGNVTVTEKGGKTNTVEVNTPEGKAVINTEKKTITEKELGVPVYPGAIAETTGQFEGTAKTGMESMQHTMLTSTDAFDKVASFYKSNLTNIQNNLTHEMGGMKMAMFTVKSKDGADISINVTEDKDKKVTRIQVIKMLKAQK